MEAPSIPPNNSNERLMGNNEPKTLSTVTRSQWFTIAILCYVNLINYMDRYTVAGEFNNNFECIWLTKRHTSLCSE